MEARQRSGNYSNKQYLFPSAIADKNIVSGKEKAAETITEFNVEIANLSHIFWAKEICDEMLSSAIARGTGISKRSPQSIQLKMKQGEAVIAFTSDGRWAGVSYISAWENGKFVSNSGLIVAPEFRKTGVGKKIKRKIFELSRQKYPNAKIFSLTTGLAVMKLNHELGFEPVTYSEITTDDSFWEGCKSCVNCPHFNEQGEKKLSMYCIAV